MYLVPGEGGVFSPGGCLPRGGVSGRGVCPGGCLPRGCLPGEWCLPKRGGCVCLGSQGVSAGQVLPLCEQNE